MISSQDPFAYRAKVVEQLCSQPDSNTPIVNQTVGRLPSVERLNEFVLKVRKVMFPDFFDEKAPEAHILKHFTAVRIDEIYNELSAQIRRAFRLYPDAKRGTDIRELANCVATDFIKALPALRDLLLTDVDAMFVNDPAATNRSEVIFCYPAFTGLLHYRIAHMLLEMGVPLLPRIITELAHSKTGIDIHPGATIGPYFSIDHGTGVVIGQTCRIGHHVSIYQGVTLGAKNFVLDDNGQPINIPRHPILEDHVTVYSNSTILGRITIGHHAIIGGNLWVTHDVPANAKLLQSPPMDNTTIIKEN